jgi:hypothetical protein
MEGHTKGDIGIFVPNRITVLLETTSQQPHSKIANAIIGDEYVPVQRTCKQRDHVWGHWGLLPRVSVFVYQDRVDLRLGRLGTLLRALLPFTFSFDFFRHI